MISVILYDILTRNWNRFSNQIYFFRFFLWDCEKNKEILTCNSLNWFKTGIRDAN